MAIPLSQVHPSMEMDITTEQARRLRLAETALDALLELHGYADVWMPCTRDEKVRWELRHRYMQAGWNVVYVGAGTSDYFVIKITKPA